MQSLTLFPPYTNQSLKGSLNFSHLLWRITALATRRQNYGDLYRFVCFDNQIHSDCRRKEMVGKESCFAQIHQGNILVDNHFKRNNSWISVFAFRNSQMGLSQLQILQASCFFSAMFPSTMLAVKQSFKVDIKDSRGVCVCLNISKDLLKTKNVPKSTRLLRIKEKYSFWHVAGRGNNSLTIYENKIQTSN